MPWPRITGDQRASSDTASAASRGLHEENGPGMEVLERRQLPAPRWNSTTFVINPMRCSNTHAAPPPMSPSAAAMAERKHVRRAARGERQPKRLPPLLLSWHDINGETRSYRC